MNSVRISNIRLWDIEPSGESIDDWLLEVIGIENYVEKFDKFQNLRPYREFSFSDPKFKTMFMLRWL